MTGVLEHRGMRYCLVPTRRPTTGEYWLNGPTLANPIDRESRMVGPTGMVIPNAVAILEEELWISHSNLVTIHGWPVYPFSMTLLQKLPPEVLDSVIQSTVVHSPSSAGEVGVEIDWNNLSISRVFKLLSLGAGVAVWPPRVIPDWKYFYLLLAPGTKKLVEKKTEVFRDFTPAVYGYSEDQADGPQPKRGDTQVTRIREAAYCRIDTIPRLLTFESASDASRTHGILPIRMTLNGDLAIAEPSGRGRSGFAAVSPVRRSGTSQLSIRLGVDFGTSNTAIAVQRSGQNPELLGMDTGVRAANLTQQVNLDPTHIDEYANRFFALRAPYSNPLPTILFESHDVGLFPGSDCLPVRAIPAFSGFQRQTIQVFATEGYLKQDFKWKPSEEAALHRRGYLEQLALIAGWCLRTNPTTSQHRDVDVVFTCPLSFTPGQTSRFKSTVEAFLASMRTCGLTTRPMQPLVSESLANLYYVRSVKPTGRYTDAERHVVIDIGGGTTDISVFTGNGSTVLLDSLYIGGKDIAKSLLLYRIVNQKKWGPVAKVLALPDETSPERQGADVWTEMAQCLLINRMATNIEALADDLAQNMPDLLTEILALLTFVTLYAVRMAALPSRGYPKAEIVNVWYAGLGSELFRLAPLASRQMHREESARQTLERSVADCADLKDIPVTFHHGTYGKKSVCLGALLTPTQPGLGDDLDVLTIWWADVPSVQITWDQAFDPTKIGAFADLQLKELATNKLSNSYETAVRTAGRLTLDGFDVKEPAMKQAFKDVADAYVRGCHEIKKGGEEAPKHPVRTVTDQIKMSVCELIE